MKKILLASDLDGTLFGPVKSDADIPCTKTLLELVEKRKIMLVYATGRHLKIALDAIKIHALPLPQAVICSVGTEIYFRKKGGWKKNTEWEKFQGANSSPGFDIAKISRILGSFSGLRMQEKEKQGKFKKSYYFSAGSVSKMKKKIADALHGSAIKARVAWSAKKNSKWLVDVLPAGISKASAIEFVRKKWKIPENSVVAAGDGGNDVEMLTKYKAVAPANIHPHAKRAITGSSNLKYFSKKKFMCGTLEGIAHFTGG